MRTLTLLLALLVVPARAEDVLPDPPRSVVNYVNPRFPENARSKGVKSARVVVELELSPTGGVTSARVLESGGADFDAAALEAVRASTFARGAKRSTQKFTVSFQLN